MNAHEMPWQGYLLLLLIVVLVVWKAYRSATKLERENQRIYAERTITSKLIDDIWEDNDRG